jgi:hypothetical protein
VAEAVKANFDIEISRQHVYAYDPKSSQSMAPRWKELHAATRRVFLSEIAEIGVAHRAVRLRVLDRLVHRCERNSVALAIECLEQAAKECGGMFENRKAAMPQPAAPQPPALQPPAPQPPLSQVPMLAPAAVPKSPALELNAERYIEYLRHRTGTRAPTQPVTGSSLISTVPPAS